MNLNNKKLTSKKYLIILLIVSIQLILVLGIILPAYEKLPYYSQKIDQLNLRSKELEAEALHTQYFKQKESATISQLVAIEKELNKNRKSTQLQKAFIILQNKYHLKVITQQIERNVIDDTISQLTVFQILEGNYISLSNYFNDITDINKQLFISSCEFSNNEPLSVDPKITATVTFNLIYPVSL